MKDLGGTDFEFLGSFSQEQPWRSWFLKKLSHTHFAQLLNLQWSAHWGQEELDYYTRLVLAMKQEYQKRFPGNEFYFVFYPGETVSALKLLPYLEKYKIRFVYYQPDILWMGSEGPMEIPGEGHPSALAIDHLAQLLAKDLTQKP